MIKYIIFRDTFEIRGRYPQGLTVEDICDLEAQRRDMWPEMCESFDDLETARKVFNETYRHLASTVTRDGWIGKYVDVVFYTLEEHEIDEDGDLVQSLDTWETAVEPLEPEGEE